MENIHFHDCTVELSDKTLTVGNSKIKRTWLVSETGIVPKTLTDAETGEELTGPGEATVCPLELSEDDKLKSLALKTAEDDDYGFAKKHLKAELTAEYSAFTLKFEIRIYPDLPIIRTRTFIKGEKDIRLKAVCNLDFLQWKEKHCEWENISMRAVTDSHNNLIHKESGLFYPNESVNLSGNILKIHRTLQNDGLVLIKEAPTPEEQVRYQGYDFTVSDRKASVCSSGYLSSDILPDEFVPLYGAAACLYHGGDAAFYRLMKDYHEARHRFQPSHDCTIICNTWGDNSGGNNICEQFLQDELDAAHDIGITHYQIDAGWDTGETRADTGESTWEIKHSKLPYDFRRLQEKAEKYGITLGLWFVPHCDDGKDYAFYQKDAQTLIGLHRDHRIMFFKLDGFKLLSYAATYRFEKMQQLVLEATNGGVFFDMDITNWPRTGFLGATQYANLFLENRYTDYLSYYPHYTLRNLWMASRYIPSYRIQSEFLNVERNAEKYESDEPGDPLSPEKCGEAYAFALTLFASPLAWFETTHLSKALKDSVGAMIRSLRSVRPEILSSLILPIGDMPNGVSFTGFQAIKDETSGYLLFLKEQNPESSHLYTMHSGNFSSHTVFTKLVSNRDSSIAVSGDSELTFTVGGPFSFAVYHYKTK